MVLKESISLQCRDRIFKGDERGYTIHQTGAKYFVTKESGKAGGFGEKVQAAKETGAVLVAVGRPKETGRTFSEVCKWLEKNL